VERFFLWLWVILETNVEKSCDICKGYSDKNRNSFTICQQVLFPLFVILTKKEKKYLLARLSPGSGFAHGKTWSTF
jgi:hypothetical protein